MSESSDAGGTSAVEPASETVDGTSAIEPASETVDAEIISAAESLKADNRTATVDLLGWSLSYKVRQPQGRKHVVQGDFNIVHLETARRIYSLSVER